jgi:hypothetical protein
MRVDDLAAKGLGRQSRNQISEYLSQRRKGRKGKNCHFDRREKSFLDPSYPLGMTGTARHLASWRDEYPNPRFQFAKSLRVARKLRVIVMQRSQKKNSDILPPRRKGAKV